MARGLNAYDAARIQGQLWDLTHLGGKLSSYTNFNRPGSLSFGTGISQARDLSGKGNHFARASGAAQPVLGTLQGSRKVAQFTTAQSMSQSSAVIATSSITHSIIVLARMRTTKQRLIGSDSTNYLFGWWQGNMATWFDGGAFRAGPSVADDGLWHLYVGTANAGTPVMRDNGVAITTSGSITGGPGIMSINGSSTGIGGDTLSDSEIFAVASCEGFALPDFEIDKVTGALLWEAGLQSQLPASHRFKNRPPLIGD